MQIIKGLIALLIVAVLVFGAVAVYNSKSEPEYEAQLKSDMLARTAQIAKRTETAATKAGAVKTNVVARHKIKNANL